MVRSSRIASAAAAGVVVAALGLGAGTASAQEDQHAGVLSNQGARDVATSTEAAVPAAVPTAQSDGALPVTGSDVIGLTVIGLGLVGTGFVLKHRRRPA